MRRALVIVVAAAIGAFLIGSGGCLAPESSVQTNDAEAMEASAADAEAGSDAKVSVPCDAGPPTAPSSSVVCLADGGACNTTSSECCQQNSFDFACGPKGSCNPAGLSFECDKASDCSMAQICCMSLVTPDTSTCPASGKTSSGTRCAGTVSCGIGQLELCAAGQSCADSTKHCKLVNVAVLGDFEVVVETRTVGVCF